MSKKMRQRFPIVLVKPHVTRRGIVSGHFRRKASFARVLRIGVQHGRTTKHDKTLTAMLPGKRKSHTGNVYYETRADRSDNKREHGLKSRKFGTR